MEINYTWDWTDFGIMFRFVKAWKHTDSYGFIDMQFGWLNVWIQIGKNIS